MGRSKKSKKFETVAEQRIQKNTLNTSTMGKKFFIEKASSDNIQNQKYRNVKKLESPAKDRLQKVVTKFKSNQLIECTEEKLDPNIKRSNLILPANKRKRESLSEWTTLRKLQKTVRSDASGSAYDDSGPDNEISHIFPLKTRAQDRLQSLQQQLNLDNATEIAETDQVNVPSRNESEKNVLQVLQRGFGFGENMNDAKPPQEIQKYEENNKNETQSEKQDEVIHVVLDTNVMLKSLSYIEKNIVKDERRFLHVPYVVLKELDSLKKRRKQADNAARAMRFIYKQLYSEQPRFQGQKAADDSNHTIQIDIDDDRILNCCVQLKNRLKNVILLTNDLNLLSKALLNDINAIRMDEYQKKCGNNKLLAVQH